MLKPQGVTPSAQLAIEDESISFKKKAVVCRKAESCNNSIKPFDFGVVNPLKVQILVIIDNWPLVTALQSEPDSETERKDTTVRYKE